MRIYGYYQKYKDAPSFPYTSESGFRKYILDNDLFTLNAIGRRIVDEAALCNLLGLEIKND